MATIDHRRVVTGLAILGMADSIYMLAYHLGAINSLACPFFGQGCNVVGRSSHARHFGIPNAAVGVAGYATMAALAAASVSRSARRWASPALAATSLSAFVASLILTWEQPFRVGAWCFWCLSSAAINLAILPLALRGVFETLRNPEELGRLGGTWSGSEPQKHKGT